MHSEIITFENNLSFEEEDNIITEFLGHNPFQINSLNFKNCYKWLRGIEVFYNEFLNLKWVTLTFWKNGKSLCNRCEKYTYKFNMKKVN